MTITKAEISALKGISIIMIIIHNTVHLLVPVHENEFQFNPTHVTLFFSQFETQPFSNFFSFWGWLGVSFFLFASGYGLSVKYGNRPLQVRQWVKRHYLKLVLLLLPAFAVYLAMRIYYDWKSVNYIECLLEQLLLLNIINPHAIQPGIFWYIGMAFQFYIWYLWFRKQSGNQLVLIALCTTLAIALLPSAYVSYIRHNSIGWMPEFVFGILLARSGQESIVFHGRALSAGFALLGITLFALSQYTFMLSGMCFVYLLLIYKTQFSKVKILLYLGNCSASLYVVHAVVRQIMLAVIIREGWNLPAAIVSVIVLMIAIMCAIPYHRMYTQIRGKNG